MFAAHFIKTAEVINSADAPHRKRGGCGRLFRRGLSQHLRSALCPVQGLQVLHKTHKVCCASASSS